MTEKQINKKAAKLGATYSRDYIATNGKRLTRHYFNVENLEVALFNLPTEYFIQFNSPKRWIPDALSFLTPPNVL